MKLYGATNCAEWSAHMFDHIDGSFSKPANISSKTSHQTIDDWIKYERKNTHARKLIIEALSDDIYAELFTGRGSDDALLSDAKALWDELKRRFTEPDIFRTNFALHRKLAAPLHIQTFVRNMAHLNTLARTHGLEEMPEWYQSVMLVASLKGRQG
ncbi:hypothetical protein BU26DRAFT_606080 [Trematosphaeria pertusa]|uniref:Uncharacterized protein n=1 Tax=Trematosphaeria pertusa TaxID=390896 RepID=A0A6A6IAF6_9PLEO|nr:uncharacterized protein BU26DRAFT_606080 [Trematosphaeria pertusa]KAF2247038.1 hypothetical protein BU26DRAFT_606080 [Trematosphaeria pertusa]